MSSQTLSKPRLETHANNFFRTVDTLDTSEVMNFYAEEATCQFGNHPQMIGRENIEKYIDQFFSYLYSMKHHYRSISIDLEQRVIYYGSMVSYVVKGDPEKTAIDIPAMTVMRLAPSRTEREDIKFVDFQVFFDSSPVSEKIAICSAKKNEEAGIED